MMEVRMKFLVLIFWVSIISCKDHSTRKYKVWDARALTTVDTAYMKTGFYYVSESLDGISMRKDRSNEIYSIAKSPFASVDHITSTRLDRQSYDSSNIIELCMTFDEQGTRDLQDGTGNSLHPKIAMVIANRLLYVVDNSSRIEKGVMCVEVEQYPEQDIAAMQRSIAEKR